VLAMAAERFDQPIFAEFLEMLVHGFGDPIGIER
jgi:hypothetical protein